jgi:hypothetical protein
MTTAGVAPTTDDIAIESEDDLTHLVCRHDIPCLGPVTDPGVHALCGRDMYGKSFGMTGPICVVCKYMARGRPVTCPSTGLHCKCVPYDYSYRRLNISRTDRERIRPRGAP